MLTLSSHPFPLALTGRDDRGDQSAIHPKRAHPRRWRSLCIVHVANTPGVYGHRPMSLSNTVSVEIPLDDTSKLITLLRRCGSRPRSNRPQTSVITIPSGEAGHFRLLSLSFARGSSWAAGCVRLYKHTSCLRIGRQRLRTCREAEFSREKPEPHRHNDCRAVTISALGVVPDPVNL